MHRYNGRYYYDLGDSKNNPVENEILLTRYNRLRTVIPRELFPDQVSYEKEIARALAAGYPNEKVNDKVLIDIYSQAFRDIEGWAWRDREEEKKAALAKAGYSDGPSGDTSSISSNNTYTIARDSRKYAKAY